MQVLKNEIKEKIDNAALAAFVKDGYRGVSMRQIANGAGMTVGNIYRYYKSKDELFSNLLLPSFESIMNLVNSTSITLNEEVKEFDDNILSIIDMFLEIHSKYSSELHILINGCDGSLIDDPVTLIRKEVSKNIETLVNSYNGSNGKIVKEEFVSEMLADGIIKNFIKILNEFDNNDERKTHMLYIVETYLNMFKK